MPRAYWDVNVWPAVKALEQHWNNDVLSMLCASPANPVNAKHLYNICTMLDRRRRRWADVEQLLYKCVLFAGSAHRSIVFLTKNMSHQRK